MALGKVPAHVRPFWEAFGAIFEADACGKFYEAFYFGDTPSDANELAQLVLSGVKRATASLLWTYRFEDKPLPKTGDLSVVTDWDGIPLCVIETTKVEILQFEAVPAEFARIEGEGDKSLEYWRDVHWRLFVSECVRMGRAARPDMPVVCEQFSVVYQPADS